MYSVQLRQVFNLSAVISRDFVRNVTLNSAAEKATEDTAELKSWKNIPGPLSLPLIGQLLHFLPGGKYYKMEESNFANILNKEYGSIVKIETGLGKPPMILLYDAESAANVLRSENWLPVRPGFKTLEYYRKKHNKTQPRKITGLISDHGEIWKEFRSTVNPIMLQPKTIKLYSTALDAVAMDMIARMKSQRDEKNMLKGKFDDEMNLWALESIAVVALGCRLNCFDPNLPEDSPARKLIQLVHDLFITADKLDFKPSLWEFVATRTFKEAMKMYEEHENISKYFIKLAMKELKTGKKSDDEKGVLEKLVEIDENVAYIMASDMLFAGVDTAANTITATLYLLATNPEKQIKLREELKSQQERRPYLRACIKESLRVMPVVSGNLRLTTKEYNIMGYKIPKNMQIVFAHQDMSLMEEHYPRPREYIPERWLVEKNDPLYHGKAHPFAHSPFGFGARSCIGRRIAELEMDTFLARVVENFEVEWFGPPPKIVQTSLNYIKGPFNFIFKDI